MSICATVLAEMIVWFLKCITRQICVFGFETIQIKTIKFLHVKIIIILFFILKLICFAFKIFIFKKKFAFQVIHDVHFSAKIFSDWKISENFVKIQIQKQIKIIFTKSIFYFSYVYRNNHFNDFFEKQNLPKISFIDQKYDTFVIDHSFDRRL